MNKVAVGAAESPWPDFKELFARLREAVTLMRRLWTEELVTFEGKFYRALKRLGLAAVVMRVRPA